MMTCTMELHITPRTMMPPGMYLAVIQRKKDMEEWW
jgi:hypothetical protein